MEDNANNYQFAVIEYYTDLLKYSYLKDNQDLGINARNKVIAKYNRLLQEEKVSEMRSYLTHIGNDEVLAASMAASYIFNLETSSPMLITYANTCVYIALRKQFLNIDADPLQIVSTFDPFIWNNDNIQTYANAVLEYNKCFAMLTRAMKSIKDQTQVKN